jgi:hypothetical protein
MKLLSDAARDALIADLEDRLRRPCTGPDGIAFPAQAHRLTAVKWLPPHIGAVLTASQLQLV